MAVALPVVTLLIRMGMSVAFGQRPLLIMFMLSLIICAMVGGLGPGLVATAVAAGCTAFFLIPPVGSFAIATGHDLVQWSLLVASGVLVSVLSETLHRARLRETARWRQLAAAQEALRKREERYRSLFDGSLDAIFSLDADGHFTTANAAALRLAGRTLEEVKALHFLELCAPDQRDAAANAFRAAFCRQCLTLDTAVIAADGSRRELFISGAPAVVDGEVVGVSCIARDVTERRKAVEELRLHHGAVQAAANGIALIDRNGKIVWANHALCRMTGYEVGELAGQNQRILKSGRHGRDFYEEMWRTILAGEVWQGEIINRRKDGSLYTEEMTITPVKDANGEVAHFIAVKQDITARKQTEAALRESEHRLRLFIENAPAAIAMFDREMRYMVASRRWTEDYGLATDVVGRSHYDLFPEIPEKWKEAHRRGLAGETLRSDGDRFDRADGSVQWVKWEVLPWRAAGGEVGGILIAAEEITGRKHAEAELAASRQRFAAIVQFAMDAIISIDAGQRIVLFNATAEKMFGCSAAEAIGSPISRFIPQRFRAEHEKHVRNFGESGATSRAMGHLGALSGLRADGSEFPIEASISKVDAGGEPLYTVILRDITMRREAEEAMARAKEAAEAANRVKSQFLANVSHEVRTPLTGIIGLNSMLLDGDLNEDQMQLAAMVQESADALLTIVNSILDFSKIEAGQITLDLVDFDIRPLLRSVSALFAAKASQKGIQIDHAIGPGVPQRLNGDPVRLRQVLMNLVGNAVKFSERGTIRVAAELVDAGESRVVLRFSVSDQGIGIPKEAHARVFESFAQADGSTTRRFGGTGLGLSICRELVELMGGGIGLESEPGRGSVFFFTARFQPASEKAAPAPAPAAERFPVSLVAQNGAEPLRVLVAEDSLTNQLIALHQLKRLGHQAHGVTNGAEAVEEATRGDYDLVLMDCQMPVLGGLEAAAEIRRREGGRRAVRIIAVTANALPGEREHCISAGMDGYLSKPYRVEKLAAEIEALFPGRAVQRPQDAPAERPVNPDILAELKRDSSGEELLTRLVRHFKEDAQSCLRDIEKATVADDHEKIVRAAHKLIGACGNFGTRPLLGVCEQIEAEACERRVDGVGRLLPLLRRELQRAGDALDAACGDAPKPQA